MNLASFPAAVFAGGCFWCLEADALHLPGVIAATSGYTGGLDPAPTYDSVCAGDSGHYEAVEIRYDPELVDYRALVDWFWGRVEVTGSTPWAPPWSARANSSSSRAPREA